MDADRFAVEATDLHARLTRAVLAMCGDRALAEDSAQEALLRAWERVDAGEDLRSLEAWTTTVALNFSRSQLRRTGAESRALGRLAGSIPRQPVENRTQVALQADNPGDAVHHAVLGLPERQREVIVLHYLLDLDVASIAKVISRSQGAVKNALFHGRAALSRELRGECSETADDSSGPDRVKTADTTRTAARSAAPDRTGTGETT